MGISFSGSSILMPALLDAKVKKGNLKGIKRIRHMHSAQPIRARQLDADTHVAISVTGDAAYLSADELDYLKTNPSLLSIPRQAELHAKHFFSDEASPGLLRLTTSRIASRHRTVTSGPSLYILVPTLQCEHSCHYCQVSRSKHATGFTMSNAQVDIACESVFHSESRTLTVEFQGGDPLLRFDLVQRAIEQIVDKNRIHQRSIRFVVASSLHQLDEAMCQFFKQHCVYLSTSIDGPATLHNKNRPTPSRDAYERTVEGIQLARSILGHGYVAALMTTTRASLEMPEKVVDEYVKLNFGEIFIRPLSLYGFAARSNSRLGCTWEEFQTFYDRALNQVIHWNQQGFPLREGQAAIVLNKLLSPFDAGYVDLQSSLGAGKAVLVYNYDGYIYPSDEARMLAETGDTSLRLGPIGTTWQALQAGSVIQSMRTAHAAAAAKACDACAYRPFCGPDPVSSLNQLGAMDSDPSKTDHCRRHLWLVDYFYQRLRAADPAFLNIAHRWAMPLISSEVAR